MRPGKHSPSLIIGNSESGAPTRPADSRDLIHEELVDGTGIGSTKRELTNWNRMHRKEILKEGK